MLTVDIGVGYWERIFNVGVLLPIFAISGTFGGKTWNADTYAGANWDGWAGVFWLIVPVASGETGRPCIGGVYTVYPKNGVPEFIELLGMPELDDTGSDCEREDENCAATCPPAWVRVAGDWVLLVIDT